jgi:hypothetical protein
MFALTIKPVITVFHPLLTDRDIAELAATCKSLTSVTDGYTAKGEVDADVLRRPRRYRIQHLKNSTIDTVRQHADVIRSLVTLRFNHLFNDPLSPGDIPDGITEVEFGPCFTQPLPAGVLPESVHTLGIYCAYSCAGDQFVYPNEQGRILMSSQGGGSRRLFTVRETVIIRNNMAKARNDIAKLRDVEMIRTPEEGVRVFAEINKRN